MVREDLTEKVTFEKRFGGREEVSYTPQPGAVNSKQKEKQMQRPMGGNLACLEDQCGGQRAWSKVQGGGGDVVRAVGGLESGRLMEKM